MLALVLRRLLLAIPLAIGVATLVFVALELAPGDPADVMLGDRPVPPEVRERLERAYGFDRPPLQRYLHWLQALFVEGELGWSHSRSRPAAQALREALGPTVMLASAALVLHLAAGLLLGLIAAAWRDRWPDRTLTATTLALYAMPTFWLGLMSVLGLSYAFELFPASSMHSIGAEEWSWSRRMLDTAWHMVLPAGVLGLASAAAMARFVRAGLIEALGQPFIRAAQARGAHPRRILSLHALRNALIPVINLIGLSLPALLSGSLVTEVVFAWPGMGRLTYDAIQALDVPVVLATTLMATLLVVVGNLLADLAMAAVDPRIRLDAGRGSG